MSCEGYQSRFFIKLFEIPAVSSTWDNSVKFYVKSKGCNQTVGNVIDMLEVYGRGIRTNVKCISLIYEKPISMVDNYAVLILEQVERVTPIVAKKTIEMVDESKRTYSNVISCASKKVVCLKTTALTVSLAMRDSRVYRNIIAIGDMYPHHFQKEYLRESLAMMSRNTREVTSEAVRLLNEKYAAGSDVARDYLEVCRDQLQVVYMSLSKAYQGIEKQKYDYTAGFFYQLYHPCSSFASSASYNVGRLYIAFNLGLVSLAWKRGQRDQTDRKRAE